MENDTQRKLDEQGVKLEAIYASVEKTRKYFLIIVWVTVLGVALPAIGLLFAIPKFINSYAGGYDGLL